MAGCAVVVKPDQQTPFSALWAARLLDEAGLPPNLLLIVTGRGRDLGGPMIQQVDFINFTGSTATGRVIARQAGERLIGCSLELGGKNPMIVLDDADVEKAAEGALRACFSNTGQLCISIERLYCHSSLYDKFLSRFAEKTKNLKLAPRYDYDADIGSISSRDQLEKTDEHVKDAVKHGATVAAGGKARPDLGPLFYEPTVLVNVPPQAAVYREETFGPLVSVYRFESIEEVVAQANDTRYGLNASIWTEDVKFGMDLGRRIECGTVNVNEGYAAAWASVDSPMGGFKDSGLGRRHGAQGILKYTEAQTIAAQHLMPLAAPPQLGEEKYSKVMSGALKVLKHIPGVR
jgi:succinate-semialdehyde dehydrogenase/glutarate-semialdehyde dehydrogenase